MWQKALLTISAVLIACQLQAQQPAYQLTLTVTEADSGKPAEGMQVVLFHFSETRSSWRLVDSQVTDEQGQIAGFLSGGEHRGVYRLVLRNLKFFKQKQEKTRYPLIPVVISIDSAEPVSLSLSISKSAYSLTQTKP